jgi:serine/threonine-protein kinase
VVDTPLHNPLDVRAGRRLSMRYRLDRLIAQGGMATVWLATDEQLRRPVAVKLLHDHLRDPISVERFRGEGKLAAQLSHPGIVAIYDTFHDHGIDGIVLEYVDGTTLRDRLDTGPALAPVEAIGIAQRVADALAEAHRRGLVHRDIKPANILLASRGAVKVTDFGIAKLLDGLDLTAPGMLVGTAKYLAPEQVTGEDVDGRTDVYALGVVLYEMLTGVAPFVGDTDAAIALARLQLPAAPLRRHRTDLPHDLEALVDRMLDRTPARRPTMHEVAATLAAAAPTTTFAPAPAPITDEFPVLRTRRRRRVPIPVVVVGVIVVFALGLAAVLVGRTDAGRGLLDKLGLRDRSAGTATTLIPLDQATLISFDPESDDLAEHNDLLRFLRDGNVQTVWTTETYASRNFGGLKKGVGVVIDLGRSTRISELDVTGASTGWNAAVYVADGAPDAIDSWGSVVARQGPIDGEARFTFAAKQGRTVMLWITDLGDAAQVRIGELALRGPA